MKWRIYSFDNDTYSIGRWRYGVAARGEPRIVLDSVKFIDWDAMQEYLIKHWK